MTTIALGSKVKDKITGFQGIAVARTVWINGCVRYYIEPPLDKDGKRVDAQVFDSNHLEVLETPEQTGIHAIHPPATGGPQNEPRDSR